MKSYLTRILDKKIRNSCITLETMGCYVIKRVFLKMAGKYRPKAFKQKEIALTGTCLCKEQHGIPAPL